MIFLGTVALVTPLVLALKVGTTTNKEEKERTLFKHTLYKSVIPVSTSSPN